MPAEQRKDRKSALVRPTMTAAERYAYKSLPEPLRRRKESVDDTVLRILDFLELVKEVGEEISVLGSKPYSPDGSGTYDPEHVTERESCSVASLPASLRHCKSLTRSNTRTSAAKSACSARTS